MTDALEQMLEEVGELPYGPARVALCQEAERLAGSDEDDLYTVRMELCNTGIFSGQSQIFLVAFTWCLAFYDRESKRSPPHPHDLVQILWRYKWCIQNLPDFAGISLGQIVALREDCERRFRESGYSLRGHHSVVGRGAIVLGDFALAQSSAETALTLKRDVMADCRACEVHGEVDLLGHAGRWADCLDKAKPLVNGTLSCEEVPTISWPMVAKARFKLGDAAGAAEALRSGVAHADNPDYLGATGQYMEGYALLGDFAPGIRLLELRFHWTIDCVPETPRLRFYSGSALLLKQALAREGEFRLRLPEATLAKCGATDGQASAMQAWLEKQARDISAQFDARNGNAFWGRHLAAQGL